MKGVEDMQGPCWYLYIHDVDILKILACRGQVNMMGEEVSKYKQAQTVRVGKFANRDDKYLMMTISGLSSMGSKCLMDAGLQLWTCKTCCCPGGLVDYEVAFSDLSGESRDCGEAV